jgi:hypothetical protein
MDEIGTGPTTPLRRHLLTPEALARAARIGQGPDLTRRHGQSNGLRIHAIIFASLSLAMLMLVIAAVAIVNPMA